MKLHPFFLQLKSGCIVNRTYSVYAENRAHAYTSNESLIGEGEYMVVLTPAEHEARNGVAA